MKNYVKSEGRVAVAELNKLNYSNHITPVCTGGCEI
jgi:hypothetical protein